MAKDFFHQQVCKALEKEGWTITHDPLYLEAYDPSWAIDLGAERMVAAERGTEKIAIEIKSFLKLSFPHEFHAAIGQYLIYRSALKRVEQERSLFLAIPLEVYESEFHRQGIANAIEDYDVSLCIYDPLTEEIVVWIPLEEK